MTDCPILLTYLPTYHIPYTNQPHCFLLLLTSNNEPRPHPPLPPLHSNQRWMISSTVERFVYTENAGSSNLSSFIDDLTSLDPIVNLLYTNNSCLNPHVLNLNKTYLDC